MNIDQQLPYYWGNIVGGLICTFGFIIGRITK